MSRARNIKPGFFKNEHLIELPYEFRLLFVGLWTLADREGRLEDRPKRIKLELFPGDSVDVDAGLSALESSGFVFRYVVDGKGYIQVTEFLKHQNPHPREAASVLPCMSPSIDVSQPRHDQGNAKDLPSRAGSSDSLIPSSLIPDPLQELHAGIEDSCATIPDGLEAEAKPKRNPVPFQQIVTLYHETLPMLPKVEKLTDARKGYISARWHEDLKNLDEWRNFFGFVARSDFLTGRAAAAKKGDRVFKADLEWITRPGNFAKIAEDKYHG